MDSDLKLSEKISGIVNRISQKTNLSKKMLAVILLFLLGTAALVLSETGERISTQTDEAEVSTTSGTNDYVSSLEERITSIISSIDGAGATQVMITLESGSEQVYLHNYDYGEDADADGSGNIDIKDEYVIVDGGDGENGIVVRVEEPRIRGVAVVCEGAGNASVKAEIIATVTALLDISSARVSVAKMN